MQKKVFSFSDGTNVIVHEVSSAGIDTFEELSRQANTTENAQDAAKSVFARVYYPVLAACTDDVPSLEEAYSKTYDEIDEWFRLACSINSDWLGTPKYEQKALTFGERQIIVKSIRPSVQMRLAKFQQDAPLQQPLDNPKDEEYRLTGHIGASACSFGDVPTAYEARHELSLKEFTAWHKAVREMVPEWYQTAQEAQAVAAADAEETKKKENGAAGNLEIPA